MISGEGPCPGEHGLVSPIVTTSAFALRSHPGKVSVAAGEQTEAQKR